MEVAEPEKTEGAPPVVVGDSSAPSEPIPAVVSEPPAPDDTLPLPEGGIAKPAVSMDMITVDYGGGALQPVRDTSLMSVLDGRPHHVLVARSTCAFSISSNEAQREQKPDYSKGIPMGMLHGITYPVITFFFLMASNASQMPQPPLHLFDNVLSPSMRSSRKWFVVFPILMWCFHFTRRLVEILCIYMARKPVLYGKVIMSLSIRIIFGFCVGWSINYHTHYEPVTGGLIVVGVLIFVVGEVGNCLSHVHLMRSAERKTIALGGIFNYVSRPHYLFEILSWLGFALTSFTLPTLLFFLMNTTVLLIRGYRRHAKYRELDIKQEKDTMYCRKRKAIIPFLF